MQAPELQGGGFILRGIDLDNAPEWLAGEDEEQLRAFESPRPSELPDVRRAIRNWKAGWEECGTVRHWAIWLGQPEVLAGGIELRDLGDWQRANLSYVVFPRFRHRDLATRACRLALSYGWQVIGVQAVRIVTLDWNVASRRVAEKLGARFVGQETSDQGLGTFDVFELLPDRQDSG